MPIRAFRDCRSVHADLDGLGARRVGGRWNSPGRPVVYLAGSLALAVLENLVHMSRADFPTGYVPVEAQIPDSIAVMAASDWRLRHPGLGERELGDRWLESRLSPVLQVRSAVVPQEFNYLLNPEHPDAAAVQVVAVQPFHFDPRLF